MMRNQPRRLLRDLERLADEPEVLYAVLYEAHESDPVLFEATCEALQREYERHPTEAGGNVMLFMRDIPTYAKMLEQQRRRRR